MELKTVLTHLKSERDKIGTGGNWSNPSALSEIGLKMATYMTYLGEYIPKLEAEYLSERGEIYTKAVEETSATAAEHKARNATIKQRLQHEIVKQFHKDMDKLISMIQSRIRVLTNEAKGNI